MFIWIVVYASVAQQVERTAVNRDVGGSSPLRSVSCGNFLEYFLDSLVFIKDKNAGEIDKQFPEVRVLSEAF